MSTSSPAKGRASPCLAATLSLESTTPALGARGLVEWDGGDTLGVFYAETLVGREFTCKLEFRFADADLYLGVIVCRVSVGSAQRL